MNVCKKLDNPFIMCYIINIIKQFGIKY